MTGRAPAAARHDDPNLRAQAKLTRSGIGGVSGIGGAKMNKRLKR